ncbi:hypothetical protein BJ994_002865 [Arthrobacter pigmenti]|uniref:Uncharacterized protein n=1 Tax=Arthrobacter pigmenti TaxID=271432 RepID=A0A846RRV9_9MICC|nr:hypothetical protein [Arthrobacter pigmenti]NJC23789.1 hypothetical protein [Arthrobacter pigmenti]
MAHSERTTGRPAMMLYNVMTLHLENKDKDDLRKIGMSKEHRIDPQIGLLVDPGGFPLEAHLFEEKERNHHAYSGLTSFHERHGVTDMVVRRGREDALGEQFKRSRGRAPVQVTCVDVRHASVFSLVCKAAQHPPPR